MALIYVDEMFLGETAEIVSLSETSPEIKQLKNMGIREGKLIDMLHYDPMCSKKIVIGTDEPDLPLEPRLRHISWYAPSRSISRS